MYRPSGTLYDKDLKEVYQAIAEELSLENLEALEEKWGKKYLFRSLME